MAVLIAWKAPLLFLYIVVCIIFPPALLAIPIVGYFWFKAAELEMQDGAASGTARGAGRGGALSRGDAGADG